MILIIDPSINRTGYAVFDMSGSSSIITSGVIRSLGEGSDRLGSLHQQVKVIIEQHGVTHAVVEIPASYSYSRSQSKWSGKGMNQAALHILNRAIGAILAALSVADIETVEVAPQQWKGRRGKGIDKLIAQQQTGRMVTSDEADAIGLGLWYIATRK